MKNHRTSALGQKGTRLFIALLCAAGFSLTCACHQKAELPQKSEQTLFAENKAMAEKGDAKAQSYLGWCFDTGQGVEKDYAEAVKWYRKAAEQNYAPAQSNLGVCYEKGLGVEKDYAEAVRWFRKATAQSYALAQYHLGVHFHYGEGVEKDYVEAMRWFLKAAEQNHDGSQAFMGVCYAEGKGVEKDYVEAYAWYNLAAKTFEVAAEGRDGLEKQMSPQQVAAAQKRTKELRTQIEAKLKSGGK
jgi:uncharacterized protein